MINNLDWLDNISALLAQQPKYQKSYFDIAGFPRWETVNSNLLAFYFNKNEEHNFNTLFIESLLKLIGETIEINVEDNFEVLREYRTKKGNYIDIVIKSITDDGDGDNNDETNQITDWAIIIENKVDTWLYNDLNDYWKDVKAKHKVGFVLAKNKIDLTHHNKNGIYYHSITHAELIEKVQENFLGYFSKSNEKHILLLKEYINNIENLYFNTMEDFNAILSKIHEHSNEIKQLKNAENTLIERLSTLTFEVFKEYGFKPTSEKKSSRSKHFYVINKEKQQTLNAFRFFVNFDNTMFNKTFNAAFELHGKKNTKYGKEIKDSLTRQSAFTNYITKGDGGSEKSTYNHIGVINIPLTIDDGQDFSTEYIRLLKQHFFDTGFISKAKEALIKAKDEEHQNQTQH
jgi:hypothetical protein